MVQKCIIRKYMECSIIYAQTIHSKGQNSLKGIFANFLKQPYVTSLQSTTQNLLKTNLDVVKKQENRDVNKIPWISAKMAVAELASSGLDISRKALRRAVLTWGTGCFVLRMDLHRHIMRALHQVGLLIQGKLYCSHTDTSKPDWSLWE